MPAANGPHRAVPEHKGSTCTACGSQRSQPFGGDLTRRHAEYGRARSRVPEPQHELELVDLADLDALNQPVPANAHEVHRGEGVCADGITVHIHPQAFEVERGTVSSHMTLDP